MNSRMDSVAENLLQHRQRLEDTMNMIDGVAKDDSTMAFMSGDAGMPAAGKTTTGVAVIDLFAKEQARKKGKAKGKGTKGQEKWLKPQTKTATAKAGEKIEEDPAELSPFMSFLNDVFGCCSATR